MARSAPSSRGVQLAELFPVRSGGDLRTVRELGQRLFEALITDEVLALLALRRPLQVSAPLRIPGYGRPHPGDQHALDALREQQVALADMQREKLVEPGWAAGQTYRDLEDALYARSKR